MRLGCEATSPLALPIDSYHRDLVTRLGGGSWSRLRYALARPDKVLEIDRLEDQITDLTGPLYHMVHFTRGDGKRDATRICCAAAAPVVNTA